jgi:hypothetical protein
MNILLVFDSARSFIKERGQWRECRNDNGYVVSECSHAWVNKQLEQAKRSKRPIVRVRV